MIEYFNEKFGVKGPFKRIELEEALIEKYGELHYFYFKGWTEETDFHEKVRHKAMYSCVINAKIETVTSYKSIEESLIGLFMENHRKLQGLVKKVYEKGE